MSCGYKQAYQPDSMLQFLHPVTPVQGCSGTDPAVPAVPSCCVQNEVTVAAIESQPWKRFLRQYVHSTTPHLSL